MANEEQKWYVRNSTGKVFGPIAFGTLRQWAADGRVEPSAGLSTDLHNWCLAPMVPELEMDWVVENNPGQFYGPTHRNVVDDLRASGSLAADARFYRDERAAESSAHGELAAAQSALARKSAECDGVRADLARRDEELAAAQSALGGLQGELVAVRNQVAALERAGAAARDDFARERARLASELESRQAEATAQENACKAKDAELARLNEALAGKTDALTAKDAELARLNDALAGKTAALAAREAELAAKDAELAAKEAELLKRAEPAKRTWTTEEVIVPEIVVDEPPPRAVRQVFGAKDESAAGGAVASGPAARPAPSAVPPPRKPSLADLERQAQAELARMGAANARKFFKFGK